MVARPGMPISGFWNASSRHLSPRIYRVYPDQKQSIGVEEPISYPNDSRPGMPVSGFCNAASRHLSPRIYRVYPDQKQSIGVGMVCGGGPGPGNYIHS